MSGIYIPGMTMPENCAALVNGHLHKCPMYDADGYCAIEGREALRSGNGIVHGRPDWCPLIELPPNGWLIDADAMIRDIEKAIVPNEYIRNRNSDMVFFLKQQDTIIPAEED